MMCMTIVRNQKPSKTTAVGSGEAWESPRAPRRLPRPLGPPAVVAYDWKSSGKRDPRASLGPKGPTLDLETRLHHLALQLFEMRLAKRFEPAEKK